MIIDVKTNKACLARVRRNERMNHENQITCRKMKLINRQKGLQRARTPGNGPFRVHTHVRTTTEEKHQCKEGCKIIIHYHKEESAWIEQKTSS